MKLVYFAFFRERIGINDEEVDLPSTIKTIADLITWQKSRGDEYQSAFDDVAMIRVARDMQHVNHDELIENAEEIAFFPPMTGG